MQGIYPTIVVVLVNAKHSVLRTAGTITSAPAHKYGVNLSASRTEYSSTAATGMDQSLHATAINLYDMTRVKSGSSGEASDTKEEGSMSDVRFETSASCDCA